MTVSSSSFVYNYSQVIEKAMTFIYKGYTVLDILDNQQFSFIHPLSFALPRQMILKIVSFYMFYWISLVYIIVRAVRKNMIGKYKECYKNKNMLLNSERGCCWCKSPQNPIFVLSVCTKKSSLLVIQSFSSINQQHQSGSVISMSLDASDNLNCMNINATKDLTETKSTCDKILLKNQPFYSIIIFYQNVLCRFSR